MTTLTAFVVVVLLVGGRAAGRARRLEAQRARGACRRAASRPVAVTTRSWWSCTPASSSRCSSRRSCDGPTSRPRSPGRCSSSSSLPRRCGGGASPPSVRRWNTRVIVVPGLAPVRSGPYRWLSHPNYVAVVAEGVALPLVHASWVTALVFTIANAALLTVRLRTENTALATLPRTPADARA